MKSFKRKFLEYVAGDQYLIIDVNSVDDLERMIAEESKKEGFRDEVVIYNYKIKHKSTSTFFNTVKNDANLAADTINIFLKNAEIKHTILHGIWHVDMRQKYNITIDYTIKCSRKDHVTFEKFLLSQSYRVEKTLIAI